MHYGLKEAVRIPNASRRFSYIVCFIQIVKEKQFSSEQMWSPEKMSKFLDVTRIVFLLETTKRTQALLMLSS